MDLVMIALIFAFAWVEVSRHKALVRIAELAAEKKDEESEGQERDVPKD